MKILIVTDAWHPQVNGVVRTYEYLREQLMLKGHEVKIIAPTDFKYNLPMPGYGEIRLTLFAHRPLCRMIKEYKPDLLHIATEGPLGLAARSHAVRHGMKYTTCYHTHFPDYAAKRAARLLPCLERPTRNIGIRFVRWFHQNSSFLFVATQSLEDTLRSWGFTVTMRRLTRGVDYEIFHEGEGTLFADLPKPVALYVGRVAVEKNLEAFLDMDWEGSKVIAGTGPDLETLLKKYPSAVFVGKQTGHALADHYRSADIFVFPSKTDTFGMVLIEAIACGLPIAAYPVTGPIDIVTDKTLGALDNDLATAAKKSLHVSGSREQRAHHARSNYSWETAAQQFLENFG